MKNWKSTMAFFVFVVAYIYSIYNSMDSSIIVITGYIALYSSVFMMLRSQMTVSILEKIVDKVVSK